MDIFSLGIILHSLLFRKFPYSCSQKSGILEQNRNAEFNFDEKYCGIPDEIMYILTNMLEANPCKRMTARKLLNFLESEFSGEINEEEKKRNLREININ